MMRRIALINSVIVLIFVSVAQAGTAVDYRTLQGWCYESNLHGKDPGWQSSHPKPSFGFGHYCWALAALKKIYLARSHEEILYQVNNVQFNTHYLISHVPESNPVMPAVYVLRGKAQLLGHRYRKAEESLTKALWLDPKYAEAYQSLIDLYDETRRKDKAVSTVKTALSYAPGNKELRRRARELGLSETQLPPLPPAEAKSKKKTLAESGGARQEEKDAEQPSPAAGETSSAALDAGEKSVVEPQTSAAGRSKKNKWCRFCPPEE